MDMTTQGPILDKTVCILHNLDTLKEGMHLIISASVMGE